MAPPEPSTVSTTPSPPLREETSPTPVTTLSPCTLTTEQIRPFIPRDGITMVELARSFSEEVLPSNVPSHHKFCSMVKDVAVKSGNKYYRKDSALQKSHNQSETLVPFKPWESTVTLASGGKVTEMSKYEKATSQFCHTVNVRDIDAFTLLPVTLTEGVLKGRHALVLEPITTSFPFMDLPPEIRQMIYDLSLEEAEAIDITTYKMPSEPRRPCRESFRVRYIRANRGKSTKWEDFKAASAGQPLSEVSILLGLSRQVRNEAAPTMYGANTFTFDTLADMKLFLESIGDMRRYIRYVMLLNNGYTSTHARSTFHLLQDATDLRSFIIDHGNICSAVPKVRGTAYHRVTPVQLVNDCKNLLILLHKAHAARGSPLGVLDVISIHDKEQREYQCYFCKLLQPMFCQRAHVCGVTSAEARKHCDKLIADVRTLVAKAVGIEE